jgi:branched-chain amino acid transport system permease protein
MEYIAHLGILFATFAILALSLDLVVGYTGLLSITHAGFYGIGAYATAVLMVDHGVNFFVAAGVGIVSAMAAAVLIGLVLSKFRADYYALASLGFNVIVYSAFLNWQTVTHGPLGIPGILKPELGSVMFADSGQFLVLAGVLAFGVYWLSRAIVLSSFGRVLKAIREDEEALSVFGYRTQVYKLVIFVIAAGMAAVAGALYASYVTYIDPTTFTVNDSIFMLSVIVLGGLGSLRGALVGAAVLVLLPEALRFVGFSPDVAAQLRLVVYGATLILLMRFRPQGLLGEYRL